MGRGNDQRELSEKRCGIVNKLQVEKYLRSYIDVIPADDVYERFFVEVWEHNPEFRDWATKVSGFDEINPNTNLKLGILEQWLSVDSNHQLAGLFWALGRTYEGDEDYLAAGHCYGAVADFLKRAGEEERGWNRRSAVKYLRVVRDTKLDSENILNLKVLVLGRVAPEIALNIVKELGMKKDEGSGNTISQLDGAMGIKPSKG